jgi:hypothetical protein
MLSDIEHFRTVGAASSNHFYFNEDKKKTKE